MAVKRGLDCYLYRNTNTYVSPTWTLIELVRNFTGSMTWKKGDASSRLSAVEMMEPTQRVVAIQFETPNDPADADVSAMITNAEAGTLTEFAMADGPILTPGTRYRRFECKAFDESEDQPLDGVSTIKWEWLPCYTTNAQGSRTLVT